MTATPSFSGYLGCGGSRNGAISGSPAPLEHLLSAEQNLGSLAPGSCLEGQMAYVVYEVCDSGILYVG